MSLEYIFPRSVSKLVITPQTTKTDSEIINQGHGRGAKDAIRLLWTLQALSPIAKQPDQSNAR